MRQPRDTDPGGGIRGWELDSSVDAKNKLAPAGVIGRAIRIKGTVRGKEDLVVEGAVEGTISLPEHHLFLEGPSRTTAQVSARNATLRGRHRGDAEASEQLEVASQACVIGNLRTPRLVVREGAKLRGTIHMEFELPPDLQPSAQVKTETSHKKKGRTPESEGGTDGR